MNLCRHQINEFFNSTGDNTNEKYAGYYGYNADGERVYKLTGMSVIDQINSGSTKAQAIFDEAVLYPNPYMVVIRKGYTKHYYAGTERLATAIGSGGFDDMGRTIGHYASREEDIAQMFYANYQNEDPFHYYHILSEMIGTSTIEGDNMPGLEYCQEPIILGRVDVIGGEDLLYSSIEDNLPVRDRERELFFSHSDHLGSANWITDYDGVPIQYLHYAPYGELVENQRVTDYDERYKFTGKERDWETGYDFFGARSYASVLSIWLSPDPLSDKYPEISPYAYCHWNPVKYIDPDGRIAIAVKPNAQNRLLSTLSCLERKYVSFDNNGKINEELLNQCQSTSHNMTALKALANSKEVTYNFLVQNASTTGETSGERMVRAGGVTEMYGAQRDPSPDPSVVNIISGDHLTGEAAATNMAHEAFGHAYMYGLTGGDTNKASHDYKPDVNNSYIGSDGTIDLLYIDTNADLQQHIQAAIKEVKNNFDCGL